MNLYNGRGAHGRHRAKPQARPELHEAVCRLGLKWLEEWRAQRKDNATEPIATKGPMKDDEKKRRARFAAAIARAEFGRNYWDERRNRSREAERRKL
jgi:hypothetical protein